MAFPPIPSLSLSSSAASRSSGMFDERQQFNSPFVNNFGSGSVDADGDYTSKDDAARRGIRSIMPSGDETIITGIVAVAGLAALVIALR